MDLTNAAYLPFSRSIALVQVKNLRQQISILFCESHFGFEMEWTQTWNGKL